MAQLILVLQDKVIKKLLIAPGGELTVGRHPGNDIVLDNLSVSGHHAKITHTADGLFLHDLGSTNGSYVNNEKVSKCRLVHQDWLGIGNYNVIVDMYETLSLEATIEMLMSGTFGGGRGADQTVMFDMSSGQAPARLVFLSGGQGDFDLLPNLVTIGKNKDADIVIRGFWSFLAGQPAVRIERQGNSYLLSYAGGWIKPRLNDASVNEPTFLKNRDELKVGPLRMRVEIS